MNNLVTLWDPISEKIRNYEILSQCSCWINQHCESIEIPLSLCGLKTSQCGVTQVTATTSITMCFFMFNISSLSFRYFYSELFKRVFTHFDHLDHGTTHSSTQRFATPLSFPRLAIPPGYVRPNNIIYEVRHNSQQRQRVRHLREKVCTRRVIRQHDGYWSIHHMLDIPETQTKIINRLFIWTSLTA